VRADSSGSFFAQNFRWRAHYHRKCCELRTAKPARSEADFEITTPLDSSRARSSKKKKSKPRVARRRCCRAVQGAAAACARCSTPAIASQACAEHRQRGSCRSSWNYGRIWRHAATRHVLERAQKSRGRGPQLIHAVSRRTIIAVTDKSKPHIHAGIKSCEQFQRSRHHMHVIMYYFRKSAVGRGGLYKNQDTPITSFA
jgi:hypothetical protein